VTIKSFSFFRMKLFLPHYWPLWAGWGILWTLAQLPYRWLIKLGDMLGKSMRFFLPKSRQAVVRRNLEICFRDLLPDERQILVKKNLHDAGLMIVESALACFSTKKNIRNVPFELSGLEILEDARASGRGVILLAGHFSHLELAGRLLTQHIPVAGMYRPYENMAAEWIIKHSRLRYADAMFARHEVRSAVKYLKAGGIIWYAPDQEMRARDSVFAPFFGVPVATITATHHLARLSGATVVPFFHKRRKDGSYTLRLEEALANFPSQDVVADTTRINAVIERMVCEAPEQYLWLHKRFKSRPEGMAKVY